MSYFDMTVNHFLGRKGSIGKTQEFIENIQKEEFLSVKYNPYECLRKAESPTKRLICKEVLVCI
jgi:hypothetical protein